MGDIRLIWAASANLVTLSVPTSAAPVHFVDDTRLVSAASTKFVILTSLCYELIFETRFACPSKFVNAAVDCLRIKAKANVNTCADYTDEHGYARRRNFLSPKVSRIGVSKTLIRVNPSHPSAEV